MGGETTTVGARDRVPTLSTKCAIEFMFQTIFRYRMRVDYFDCLEISKQIYYLKILSL